MQDQNTPTREQLLQRVAEIAPLLDATAAQSEAQRKLCPEAVDALHDAGLFGLWGPLESGGYDADLVTQVDVLIEVARADMSACWNLMIGNTVSGIMARGLPEEGFREVFSSARLPIGAGSLKPAGRARAVEGGYVANGKWGFGSGIHHCDWIIANCLAEAPPEEASAPVSLVVPISEVEIHDDWHVAGLAGSGSSSYSIEDVFVPAHRVISTAPLRGSARNGNPGPRLPVEHAAVSLGGARRALDEVTRQAIGKHRLIDPQTVADKQAFQTELGKLEAQWATLRAGVRDMAASLWRIWAEEPSQLVEAATEFRAICAYATEHSLVIGSRALRHAGAGAVHESNVLQRILRDLTVSAQHVMISDGSYEDLGKLKLRGPGR